MICTIQLLFCFLIKCHFTEFTEHGQSKLQTIDDEEEINFVKIFHVFSWFLNLCISKVGFMLLPFLYSFCFGSVFGGCDSGKGNLYEIILGSIRESQRIMCYT